MQRRPTLGHPTQGQRRPAAGCQQEAGPAVAFDAHERRSETADGQRVSAGCTTQLRKPCACVAFECKNSPVS